ncbi:PDZ domain-containing protein [Marininema halotolerans]|uniref:PDZ domain-containing protein n=1 Tax=Marininema halotolerans TaxID=1155944 RepID=A0A1I6NYB9_9BACL|nr:PDZ domain-containing protein [Marininema halotolerans]SFS32966.1 PDZ domain-containing protein [Marininema halotolerans]
MEPFFLLWESPWGAWKVSAVHPFWLLAILLVAWQYAWKGIKEQKKLGSRLHPPTPLFLRSLLFGIGGGLLFSFGVSSWMFEIDGASIPWVWGGVIGMFLIRPRFACPSYAIGVLTFVSLCWEQAGWSTEGIWLGLSDFHTPDWLLLMSALHGLEWLLVRLDGQRGSTPIVEETKAGQVVGGALLQKIWALPLVIGTPNGWLPLPLVIGFSRVNLSRPMRQQKRRSSSLILVYAGLLGLVSWGAMFWPAFMWLAASFCILGHEGIYQLGRIRERRRSPLFTSNEKGVNILAVWPNSPAKMMHIKPGDTVLKVNGMEVTDLRALEHNISTSGALCRLEVMDRHGETRLSQRVLYEGDPVHLGIVEIPKAISLNPTIRTQEHQQ